eukprot:8344242-Alexandrium_andersonii.AAC.1
MCIRDSDHWPKVTTTPETARGVAPKTNWHKKPRPIKTTRQARCFVPVSYTHLRAHETSAHL